MNLTKEHKTGVIYGPDHRLHWRVTTPMPRALVCVNPLTQYVHTNTAITMVTGESEWAAE